MSVVNTRTQISETAYAIETMVGCGQVVWFAYVSEGVMLRDKRGVGRRFKSFQAAKKAMQ